MHRGEIDPPSLHAGDTDDARGDKDSKAVELIRESRPIRQHDALLHRSRQNNVRNNRKRHPSQRRDGTFGVEQRHALRKAREDFTPRAERL